jgi:hypothetical protein
MVARIVDGLVGTVAMRTKIGPRMGYGQDVPTLLSAQGHLVATTDSDELWLDSDVDLSPVDGAWSRGFTVEAGERVSFTLSYAVAGEPREPEPTLEAGAGARADS